MKIKRFTMTGIPVEEIVAHLAEPFEPQAYKGVPGGADLTDINTGYMIERATQVFGLRGLGWKLEYSPTDLVFIGLGEGKRVTAHLKYAVFSYALVDEEGEIHWYPIITGGASANELPYAEEGARTAAIGAALKSLCFQLPVYKGQLDHHNAGRIHAEGKSAAGNGSKNGGNGSKPPAAAVKSRSSEEILQELGFDSQPEQKPADGGDPGAYVIRYGKTYAGWTLRKIVEENPKGREAGLTALR